MKQDLLWTKTILSVYRYLSRVCGAIDKIIEKTALGSANFGVQTYYFNNVMSISQRIIDLSQRKVTLINLKILVDDCLKGIGQDDAKILIARYFDGEKRKQLAEKFNISMRTVFRRVECAEVSFSKVLRLKGFDDEKMKDFLRTKNG